MYRGYKIVDPELFLSVYMDAYDKGRLHTYIADRLGISKDQVRHVARNLRRKGVPLPKLRSSPNHKTRMDIDAVRAAYEAELNKGKKHG